MAEPTMVTAPPQAEPAPEGRRTGRRIAVWTVVVLAVAGVIAAALGLGGRGTPRRTATTTYATAPVTRSDLVAYVDVSGTLGYGPETTVNYRGSGGVVTALPAVGAIIAPGARLYSVDTQPVVLLKGALPLYRTVSAGTKGPDVRELERNLAAFGYHGFTVDSTFTGATAAAVRHWQKAIGMAVTGTVTPGDVVVAAGPVRVASRKLAVGDPASGAVITVTGTIKQVSAQVPVSDAAKVKTGAQVKVDLPEAAGLTGTVAHVGTVATVPSNGSQPANPADATVPMTVRLTDAAKVAAFDGAPATIRIVTQRRQHVLCVPVQSLLALREGGFGVEVAAGDRTRIVAITPGLFAGGLVEVASGDVREGMQVVVPG